MAVEGAGGPTQAQQAMGVSSLGAAVSTPAFPPAGAPTTAPVSSQAQQAMGASTPVASVQSGSQSCVHPLGQIQILSNAPCMDGPIGIGIAALGVLVLFMGVAVLTGVASRVPQAAALLI